MQTYRDKLVELESKVNNREVAQATVREFLAWFGYERRGWRVVKQIRSELSQRNLVTQPDFEFVWIDGVISFSRPKPSEPSTEKTDYSSSKLETGESSEHSSIIVGGVKEDPTYRIGKLDAANNPPFYISPNSSVQEAITIMLRDDYSQMPVMTSDRDVKGAITWKSIAKHFGLGHACASVRECMDLQVEIVGDNVSLFRVIELVRDNDFVLVRNTEKRIVGIVTVADLSESLHQLGEPFLLLSEIENHIRGMIDGRFTVEELGECRNPNDLERGINDVSDLTFGEYVRLLQKPEKWNKVGLAIDRSTFIKDLERVNRIRNDVMHFDPDGIGKDDLQELSKTAKFVQELRSLVKE